MDEYTRAAEETPTPEDEKKSKKKAIRKTSGKEERAAPSVSETPAAQEAPAEQPTQPRQEPPAGKEEEDHAASKDTAKAAPKLIHAKDQVTLPLTFLYTSSVAKTYSKTIQGRYYLWDNRVVNHRIRLTDSPAGAGNPEKIVGWVDTISIHAPQRGGAL